MTCDFCWRHCDLQEGQKGFCQIRQNRSGKIVSLHYGQLVSLAIDPIEKKPLYHFLPGSQSLSLAEAGCNYRCAFCQNYEISQPEFFTQGTFCSPERVVQTAREYGVGSISYTYSEPTVWQDYMVDTATLAKERGIRNVMVTNGSFSEEARKRILPVIDAFNIDVKGDGSFYQEQCAGNLDAVLENIGEIVRQDKHLEVTTLLIEGIHTEAMVEDLGTRLRQLGVQVWHLSRFFPRYKMEDRRPTSEAFLEAMLKVAENSGIPYIYGGNSIHIDETRCPRCHAVLIHDHAYEGRQKEDAERSIDHGSCAFCGYPIYGVFS